MGELQLSYTKQEFEEWKQANKEVGIGYLHCIKTQQRKIRTEQAYLKKLENYYYETIICEKPEDVNNTVNDLKEENCS